MLRACLGASCEEDTFLVTELSRKRQIVNRLRRRLKRKREERDLAELEF